MPIIAIIQPVYYSETFYTEYFHYIPICNELDKVVWGAAFRCYHMCWLLVQSLLILLQVVF